MKKLGVMISDQHLIAHGGIGQFVRSLIRMANQLDCQTVLITDRKPRKGFISDVPCDFMVYPSKPLSYKEHREQYGRFSEGPNHTKADNFITALRMADMTYDLDVVVANSSESLAALGVAHISDKTKRIMYTHSYRQIHPEAKFNDIFTPEYHTYYQQYLYQDDIIVGTQSEYNKMRMLMNGSKNVEVLPMPLTEPSLLEPSNEYSKSGVLYIGRWEDGKNPKDYLKVIKQTKLPAKVMTNKIGAKKFEKAFNEMGHTDYEIKAGIIGREKSEFIKGCKVFLCTGLHECFPNTYVECLGHMPIVTLSKMTVPWTNSFPDMFVHKVDIKQAHALVNMLYNARVDNTASLKYVNDLHNSAYTNWGRILT
jgi:glycosyltransferase involved in cell wall biosynthesis